MISNIPSLSLSPLGALIFPSTISHTRSTHPTTSFRMVGIHLVIRVTLWATCAISVGVSLVLSLLTCPALSMSSFGSSISIFFGIFMPLRAAGNVRLPAVPVIALVFSILNWRAPVEIFQRSIHRIIVFMKCLHAIGARGNESLKHKNVYPDLPGFPISIQGASRIAMSLNPAGHHLSKNLTTISPYRSVGYFHRPVSRSNTPDSGDLIIGVVKYRRPSFLTSHTSTITSLINGGN